MACAQQKVPADGTTNTPPIDSLQAALAEQKKQVAEEMAKAQITHFIIHTPDQKFGYSIFINGQMYIEQKTIPAIEGNNGFATEQEAESVAQLAMRKIREGEMPPTVSVDELKALGVKF